MHSIRQRSANAHIYSKLLAQFSCKRLLRALSRLDLPAGKLPHSGAVFPLRPSAKKKSAVSPDAGGYDLQSHPNFTVFAGSVKEQKVASAFCSLKISVFPSPG